MTNWEAAQWLLASLLGLRCLNGILAATGVIAVRPSTESKWIRFAASRLVDLGLVVILWWGHFW